MDSGLSVWLRVNAYEGLLPVATGFVEKSALAFGLGKEESLTLTLAAEEIFLYLSHVSDPGKELEIRCHSTGYCVETTFVFETSGFPLKVFNLTALPSFEDEAASRETGLLIASRLLDRFHVEHIGPRLSLTLGKDKAYPEADSEGAPACVPVSQYEIRRPDPEEVKAAVRMVRRYCRIPFLPLQTRWPGKVADIFAAGHVDAALAVDAAGHMGGILFWTRLRRRAADCFGPYVFHPDSDPEMPARLLDRCLEEIGRSGALGLINRHAGTGLPSGYFEVVGSMDFYTEDGTRVEVEASYRQLEEDRGAAVWVHPDLVPFLDAQYRRLALPRAIHCVTSEGENRGNFTVLSAEMDRPRHWVVLRPMTVAEDAEQAVADHVRLLLQDGFRSIFFEMNLKHPWEAHLTPPLMKNGFEPRFILPYGFSGDLAVFQYGTRVQA